MGAARVLCYGGRSMNKILASVLLVFAACGGSKAAPQSPTGGPGEPMVDPTMPSWVPASCNAYHKAVVEALSCDAIEQGKRDEIRQAFDAASTTWKAEQDATPARVEEVGAACTSSGESVRAEITGKCLPASK